MRLNFSGVGEDDIREGVRRIGEIVREQLDLYGTLTGRRPTRAPNVPERGSQPPVRDVRAPEQDNVLRLRRRAAGER